MKTILRGVCAAAVLFAATAGAASAETVVLRALDEYVQGCLRRSRTVRSNACRS